jgi:hypothetical protein
MCTSGMGEDGPRSEGKEVGVRIVDSAWFVQAARTCMCMWADNYTNVVCRFFFISSFNQTTQL